MHEAYGITAAIIDALPAASTPTLCSIYIRGLAKLPSGQTDPNAAPVLLPNHELLDCRIGPMIKIRPTDKQEKRELVVRDRIERHVFLRGYYNLVTVGMLCLVNGYFFTIVGVNHDSNRILTRLHLEIVAV